MGLHQSLPDSISGYWLERVTPLWVHPYIHLARLERPVGWWLLLLPCWWSLTLALPYGLTLFQFLTYSKYYLLFWVGAVAMRGAGCTYNDILDRKLDAQVYRTARRPLASGQVSLKQAVIFLTLQCLIGLVVILYFNPFAILLGICSLLIVLIYPFAKRVFWLPQLVLGMAFSWGALMGWASLKGNLSPSACFLYVGTIFWTIGYDTIYALQDIEDDILVGIHSSARFFGDFVQLGISICYGAALVFFTLSLLGRQSGFVAYVAIVFLAVHFLWQIIRLNRNDPSQCLFLFRSNQRAGLIFLIFLILDIFI